MENLQRKQITLYYWLHNDITIYRFTIIHFIPFYFFYCSTTNVFPCFENPPNEWANLTRQTDPPKCLAMETRQIHPRTWPAKSTCQRSTPSPLKIPQAGHDLPASPPSPPHGSANGVGGRGRRVDPARLCILNRYFYFSLSDYIFSYNTTHTYSTQGGWNKVYKCIALGEGKVARRGWGAGLLPAPLKGVFCIIRALQEVSRHAILTRIGYKHVYNIPLYSNEYISA